MYTQNIQQYQKFIQGFSTLFDGIRKEGDPIYNSRVDFNAVKFLIKHPIWNLDTDEDKNEACEVILQEHNKMQEGRQGLQRKAKEILNEYIYGNVNDVIKEVSIYGDHASIELKDNKKEFKISEFLNSDFCQKNGISGFSTLHSDGKSGMHGFIAKEGEKKIRHYVVTDGSYEMTLNWYAEGEKCTIKIKIDKDGVDLIEPSDVTKEQLKANKDVKIGGLFLYQIQFREKGQGREQENQQSSETFIESNSKNIGVQTHRTLSHNQDNRQEDEQYNNPTFVTFGHTVPGSQKPDGKESLENFQSPLAENSQNKRTPPPSPLRTSSLKKDVSDEQKPQNRRPDRNEQTPNNQQQKRTPPPPPLRTSSPPSKGNVVSEQTSAKPASHNQDNRQEDKRYDNPTFATFGYTASGSQKNERENSISGNQQQEGNSRKVLLQDIRNFKVNNLRHTDVDGRTKRNRENNPWKKLMDKIPYSSSSDIHEYNSDNQDASDAEWKETLSAPKPNRGVSSSTADHSQSQADPKHLNRKFEENELNHQKENKAPEEHGKNSNSGTHKIPIINLADQAIGELLEKSDKRVKEQAQQVTEENISKDQFSKNVLQKIKKEKPIYKWLRDSIAGKEDNQNLDLPEKNSKSSQSDVVEKREDSSNKPLSPISTEKNIDKETQKFPLNPVNQKGMSEQTKEHLLAAGLLKDNAAETKINDSGYSSPTYTSHYNFQVNPEQLEKRLETIEPKKEDTGELLEKSDKRVKEEAQQATKDLFSESMLEEIKEGKKYDPVRKLLERKVAEQENDNTNLTIDKNSELYKLLEKDAAQLKVGVIEEEKEDTLTEYIGSPDRNKVALANKNRKLLWTKRIAEQQEKDDGISI